MGLLKTLAIFVIIYYIFKFFSRYIAPIFLRKVMSDAEKKFREQQQYHQQQQHRSTQQGQVGETVIDKKPVQQKEGKKDVGDYVDYEEIKE